MKKILFLIISLFVLSCSSKPSYEKFYINESVVIRQTNESEGFTQSKFRKPMVAGKWLVESVEHPGNFMEMSTEDDGITCISRENWYGKIKGDTLHFDYIRKEHFFEINK